MGLQSENTANSASVLVIDQACDNDQLLVSLSKNEAQWLSPVGWTDQQKVTLLDCRANGETTEIDIPIKSGDVLVLRCSELDFEKEIIWEASEIETRKTEEVVPAATGLAGGLLSRFKGSKAEPVEETKSEAEVRAEEADRAAQNFKAKMEAATAAKEQAQRKALDAAREAEAALKMEAERITEMERAAKAFEEAERLKQDELRRVEEERRAEEARLAEEARRIEEARKREIAAKKEAERKAALERYEAALDITRNEEVRLKSRLKDLKKKSKSEAANNAVQAEDLQSRRGLMVATEETTTKRFDSFEKSASKLDVINAELSMLQTESETLGSDRQAISIRLSQADADYQKAQAEAETAIARAETRRAELDVIRREDSDISGRMSSVSEKLSSQSQIVSDASEKTQKLKLKFETSQAELTRAKTEIEALEQALLVQAEQDQNLRLEIEATQQAIEDSQARELNHREAIEHLEAGGAPEEISDVEFEPRRFEPSQTFETSETVIEAAKADKAGFKDRMMGRVRSTFAREKDAQISIDVEDVVLESDIKTDPVLLVGLDDTPSFVRRHGSSLMALGAVIGGVALLGGAYAFNKSASPKHEVKSNTTVPTQVMSVVTKAEFSKSSELVEATAKTVPIEAPPSVTDIPKIETVAIEPMKLQPVTAEVKTSPVAETSTPETEQTSEDVMRPKDTEENSLIVKLAEVADPTGFAFELPNMMPVPSAKNAIDIKPAAKKTNVKKPTPKIIEQKEVTRVKDVIVTKIESKPVTPKTEETVNYPELTKDIQTRLFTLGFYTGEIDGIQGGDTKDAIRNFKTLFSMPEVDGRITGALLTELKRAEREQEAAQLLQATKAEVEAQAAIQVADVTPEITFYDIAEAVPTEPVVTDTLPAASAFIPTDEPTPSYVAPEPEPVKVASIPAVTEASPTPALQDIIVEAKLIKNAGARYPKAAEERDYFVNVNIIVGYDIDVTGEPSNVRVESSDHTGRFKMSFEKAAMKSIKKLRFDPKTVNGVAVVTEGRRKRVAFRGE